MICFLVTSSGSSLCLAAFRISPYLSAAQNAQCVFVCMCILFILPEFSEFLEVIVCCFFIIGKLAFTVFKFLLKDHKDTWKGKKLQLCWKVSIREERLLIEISVIVAPRNWTEKNCIEFSLLMHRTNADGPEDDRKIFWLIFSDDSNSVIKEHQRLKISLLHISSLSEITFKISFQQ